VVVCWAEAPQLGIEADVRSPLVYARHVPKSDYRISAKRSRVVAGRGTGRPTEGAPRNGHPPPRPNTLGPDYATRPRFQHPDPRTRLPTARAARPGRRISNRYTPTGRDCLRLPESAAPLHGGRGNEPKDDGELGVDASRSPTERARRRREVAPTAPQRGCIVGPLCRAGTHNATREGR